MTRVVCAGVAALLITWQGMAGAQSRTYRSGVELVNVNVSVVGANLQHVDGLTADHFEVLEDGVSQRVQFFASGELPLDVGILLDTSGSMAQEIPQVQQAAKRFVASLRAIDRGSVMAISSGLRVLQPFTSETSLINQAIDSIGSAGDTPLYTSVYSAHSSPAILPAAGQRLAALVNVFDALTDQGAVRGVVAHFTYRGRTYQLLGYAALAQFGLYQPVFQRVIGSLAAITDPAILGAQPRRVDIVRLDAPMTLAEFSRRYQSAVPVSELAVINQASGPDARFDAGSLLKRVVS